MTQTQNQPSDARVLSQWYSMYADWEEGQATSPSILDLVKHYLAAANLTAPDFEVVAAADYVDVLAQDSASLEHQLSALQDFIAKSIYFTAVK